VQNEGIYTQWRALVQVTKNAITFQFWIWCVKIRPITFISKLPIWNCTDCPIKLCVKFPGDQPPHIDDGIVKCFHFVLGQTRCKSNSCRFWCC